MLRASMEGGLSDTTLLLRPPSLRSDLVDPGTAARNAEDTPCVGAPIDVATSATLMMQTDLTLPRSLPLQFTRTDLSRVHGDQEDVTQHGPPGMAQEELQQVELPDGQRQFVPCAGGPASCGVHEVQDHQVRWLCGRAGHGGGTVGGHVDGEARPGQVSGDDLGDGRVVVHDQYAFHGGESRTVPRLPSSVGACDGGRQRSVRSAADVRDP